MNRSGQLFRIDRSGRASGFTLIELLLVLFITALLTIMAVPSLMHTDRSSKLQQACSVVMAQLYRARQEAINSRRMVTVYFGDDITHCPVAPTPGVLPPNNSVQMWTVKTNGSIDGVGANDGPYYPLSWSIPAWYPYETLDRCLSPVPEPLPGGIRVLAGLFKRTSTSPIKVTFGWGPSANYQRSADGELKRHNVTFSKIGSMPGWYDGLNSYYTLLVFDEVTGEHQLIWVGEWLISSKPRILPYQLTGVYGPSGALHTVTKNSDLSKYIDQ